MNPERLRAPTLVTEARGRIYRRRYTPEERFWRHVERGSGCWEWTGSRDRAGYGQFEVDEQNHKAHRIAWTLTNGVIPTGLHVLHACDNPPCVRPSHLWLGTDKDNSDDKIAKGRARTAPPLTGEANPAAKLTADHVRAMRVAHESGETTTSLARRFGTAQANVWLIVNRKAWRHVS